MSNESTKNPAAVYQTSIGTIAVAGIAALVFVIMPNFNDRSAIADEVNSTRTQTTQFTELAATLEAKASDNAEAIKRLETLSKSFPNTYAQSQFLNMIEDAADAAGVRISSATTTVPDDPSKFVDGALGDAPAVPQAPPPVEGAPISGDTAATDGAAAAPAPVAASAGQFPLAQIGLDLTIEGTQNATQRFLARLAKLERPVVVDSITMGEGEGASSTTLKARTYLSRPLIIPDRVAK